MQVNGVNSEVATATYEFHYSPITSTCLVTIVCLSIYSLILLIRLANISPNYMQPYYIDYSSLRLDGKLGDYKVFSHSYHVSLGTRWSYSFSKMVLPRQLVTLI